LLPMYEIYLSWTLPNIHKFLRRWAIRNWPFPHKLFSHL